MNECIPVDLRKWGRREVQMRSRSEKEGIGKVVEISVLGIASRLLRARREYLFPQVLVYKSCSIVRSVIYDTTLFPLF